MAAQITGKHVSCVYRWMYSRARGGTDGIIPSLADADKLLAYARDKGIDLSADDFFRQSESA